MIALLNPKSVRGQFTLDELNAQQQELATVLDLVCISDCKIRNLDMEK